jgi:hypothetical protein
MPNEPSVPSSAWYLLVALVAAGPLASSAAAGHRLIQSEFVFEKAPFPQCA